MLDRTNDETALVKRRDPVASRLTNNYTSVPKSFPTLAVSAIAKAPQNVTRAVALTTWTPPAFAPTAIWATHPNSAFDCRTRGRPKSITEMCLAPNSS